MPLPRFHRLDPEVQSHLLAKAEGFLAEITNHPVSYNHLIESLGVSKTSAYQYFDGKEDLIATVVARVVERLTDALGCWCVAPDCTAFWLELENSSSRLRDHLLNDGPALVLLAKFHSYVDSTATDSWFEAVLDNGMELGVIKASVDRRLLHCATVSLFEAMDRCFLEAALTGRPRELESYWVMVRALWATPPEHQRTHQ